MLQYIILYTKATTLFWTFDILMSFMTGATDPIMHCACVGVHNEVRVFIML